MEPFELYRPSLFSGRGGWLDVVTGGMVSMAEGPLAVEWKRSTEWLTSNREIR